MSVSVFDELGQGTSSVDGQSLACAVIEYLHSDVQCLAFFATHFGMLMDKFANNSLIGKYQMSGEKKHKFKFIQGVASESIGSQVARLAGLPSVIIDSTIGYIQEFVNQMKECSLDEFEPQQPAIEAASSQSSWTVSKESEDERKASMDGNDRIIRFTSREGDERTVAFNDLPEELRNRLLHPGLNIKQAAEELNDYLLNQM